MRVARTLAAAKLMRRDAPNEKAASERSESVSFWSSSRERGPITPSTASADVASKTDALMSRSCAQRSIQARSF